MASAFNPDEPYSECTPAHNGATYYQNGLYYDVAYNQVNIETGEIVERAKQKPQEPKSEKKPVPTQPRRSQMPPVKDEDDDDDDDDDDKSTAKADHIDLVKWAKGEVKYQFYQVRAEVLNQFGKTPANAKEAREIITG